jgi:methyltransferase
VRTLTSFQLAGLQLLLVFVLARGLEVFASALRLRIASAERGAKAEAEPWYRHIVLVHVALFAGCFATLLLRGRMPPLPLLYGALGALCVALLLRAWVFVTLRSRWNVRVVDPGAVATNGPYRFLRHPNYLAVIIEVAALPLAVGAYEVAVLGTIANALVLSWRIPFEEKALAARHAVYRDVMMRRPRFLPVSPWKRSPRGEGF